MDQNYNGEQNDHGVLRYRSGRSRLSSFLRFVNRTNRRVDVIWLNYEGMGVRYRTLDVNSYVNVNTFAGHLWIFRDGDTGDKLVVELREVYDPIPHKQEDGPPHRRTVNITLPVYTLRERCMQVVCQLIPLQNLQHLELPETLKMELFTYYSSHQTPSAFIQPNIGLHTNNIYINPTTNHNQDNNNESMPEPSAHILGLGAGPFNNQCDLNPDIGDVSSSSDMTASVQPDESSIQTNPPSGSATKKQCGIDDHSSTVKVSIPDPVTATSSAMSGCSFTNTVNLRSVVNQTDICITPAVSGVCGLHSHLPAEQCVAETSSDSGPQHSQTISMESNPQSSRSDTSASQSLASHVDTSCTTDGSLRKPLNNQ